MEVDCIMNQVEEKYNLLVVLILVVMEVDCIS